MKKNFINKNKLTINFYDIFGIFILFLVLLSTLGLDMPRYISNYQVQKLAKDYRNIKSDGCLMYANVTDKHGGSMFYINQKGAYTLKQITFEDFPFEKRFSKLIKDDNINYYEFKKIHTKECIKVRYVHHKFLWVSGDYIYDFQ